MSAAVPAKRFPLPASSCAIALRVVAFGALTSKGQTMLVHHAQHQQPDRVRNGQSHRGESIGGPFFGGTVDAGTNVSVGGFHGVRPGSQLVKSHCSRIVTTIQGQRARLPVDGTIGTVTSKAKSNLRRCLLSCALAGAAFGQSFEAAASSRRPLSPRPASRNKTTSGLQTGCRKEYGKAQAILRNRP